MKSVTFTINGKIYQANQTNVEIDTSLNTFIRDHANLKGTKYMCREGGCGACIVTVQSTHPVTKQQQYHSVNSCLVPVLACHGCAITTIEGLGNKHEGYHQLQTKLAALNGTQCGYCTPGMIMNMFSLLKCSRELTMLEIENSFGGNICRCTGYRPILDTFKSFAKDADDKLKQLCTDIEELSTISCSRTGCRGEEQCGKSCPRIRKHSQEINDSSDLGDFIEIALAPNNLKITFLQNNEWYKVDSISEIMQLFDLILNKQYILLAGNTARGVYPNLEQPQVYIDIKDVAELRYYNVYNDHIELGANMTLTEVMNLLNQTSINNPLMYGYTSILAQHIDLIAHVSVRNIGTLAGNLSIKRLRREFPSDIFLILETVGAHLEIHDPTGIQHVLTPDEFLSLDMFHRVMTKIILPALSSNHYYLRTFKIMARKQNVHAHVNAGFLFRFNEHNNYMVEEKPNIVIGGISKDFVHAYQTEHFLIGRPLLSKQVILKAIQILYKELQPDFEPTEASPNYKKLLAVSLFYRYILSINTNIVNKRLKSGSENLFRPISSGKQNYSINKTFWPLNRPIQKLEAILQCSGEAEYINDMPKRPGELFGALVLTDRAQCSIISIDPTPALRQPGVVAFYSAKDIPYVNTFVTPTDSVNPAYEELFCSGRVLYAGQTVGIVIAITQELAIKVANDVVIQYTKAGKPLLTIKDVLESGDKDRIQLQGKLEPMGTGSDIHYKLSGEYCMQGQYHYTMELQTCLSEPIEDGLNIYSSTQQFHITQGAIALVLGIPENSINIELRRVGGAYGCKITRSSLIATSTALAAYKLKCPVKMVLNLETNMRGIGKRCPVLANYEVAINASGLIQYLIINLYSNFGSSLNDNTLPLALTGLRSCYDVTRWRTNLYSVLTDQPSNTWTRAPGTLEAMSTVEHIMEHIAFVTKLDSIEVRKINLGQEDGPVIREMLQTLQTTSNYHQRKQFVQQFNVENRWKKRGIGFTPMTFRLELFPNFYSMVSIYFGDGTVAVTTGGVEMGQGINTKVAQVCAYVLGIDVSMIQLKPNRNLTSPNNNPTVASMATDTVCYATLRACQELQRRLQPIRAKMSNPTWKELVRRARDERVNLNASYMFDMSEKNLTNYSIYGVTFTEVEVDLLTGQYQIIRADVLEDAGESLNPLLDIGQVEGAFVMGLGYFNSEQLVYDPNSGKLLTDRTWTYWPPGARDIPIDFRISLRRNAPNPLSVLRSKATGEPALCMTISLMYALREALTSARKDADLKDEWFQFSQPCTFEEVLLTSGTSPDQFVIN